MSSATAQAPAKNGRGTLYRGHGGMWSWVGHRVTGVVIFFYPVSYTHLTLPTKA